MRLSPPGGRRASAFVAHPLDALAVELVEVEAMGLVSDKEIEDGQTALAKRAREEE